MLFINFLGEFISKMANKLHVINALTKSFIILISVYIELVFTENFAKRRLGVLKFASK